LFDRGSESTEQYTTHISELEMLQLQLKAQIENGKKLHLKNLEQSLADLQKLKREIFAIAPTTTKAESSCRHSYKQTSDHRG
jgi:hypothetical protein